MMEHPFELVFGAAVNGFETEIGVATWLGFVLLCSCMMRKHDDPELQKWARPRRHIVTPPHA